MATVKWKYEVPAPTTVTGGLVVIARVGEASDIMKTIQIKEQVNNMKPEHTSVGLQSSRAKRTVPRTYR